YPASAPELYTNRMKVQLAEDFHYISPDPRQPDLLDRLNQLTAAVFQALSCHEVARGDFRLDSENNYTPHSLEITPLPGPNPAHTDLCIEASAAGWTYEQLIGTIVQLAAERYGLPVRI